MRMEAAVVSVLVNVSNFTNQQQQHTNNVVARGLDMVDSNELTALNADFIAQLRHVERTLLALQRNLDDFYFVSLTAITFGKLNKKGTQK